MTLKEKLKPFAMDNHIEKYAEHNAKECEKIAEEFAIGFLEFTESTYSFGNIMGKWYLHADTSKQYTRKELLQIYKKEKRL
jgi:hypothetical protein